MRKRHIGSAATPPEGAVPVGEYYGTLQTATVSAAAAFEGAALAQSFIESEDPYQPGPRPCSETTKKGLPCQGYALPGDTVCVGHRNAREARRE